MFQVAILSQKEDVLGFLNPDVVDIEEYNEEKGLRQITIKHPLLDREGRVDIMKNDEHKASEKHAGDNNGQGGDA